MLLSQNPLFAQLKNADNILIAVPGVGNGVYYGVPLHLTLRKMGIKAYLK